METLQSVCRTCLLGDVKINNHYIEETQLIEIYEKLTCTKLNTEDKMPKRICFICHSLLQRFQKFSKMAVDSQKILQDLCNSGVEEVTLNTISTLNLNILHNLSMTPAQSVSMDDNFMDSDFTVHSKSLIGNRQVNSYVYMYDTPVKFKVEINVKHEMVSADEMIKTEKETENEDKINFSLEKHFLTETSYTDGTNPNVCDICSKKFTTIHLLKSHMITHSGEKPYTCKKCEKSFSRKHNMVQHMNTCLVNEQSQIKSESNSEEMSLCFYCNVCNKKFATKHHLSSHLITHSGEKPYSCEGCKKTFSRKQNMKQHMKICTEVTPTVQTFPCTFCSQFFDSESDLNNHIIIHDEQKPFNCEKCNKGFSRRPNLKQHMKICYLENEPVNCTICPQTFTSRSDLCKHLNMDHIEEKPYICDRCSTKFWHKSHLKAHMRIHTGEKPYTCERCGKTFTLRNHLRAHIGIHTGVKPFACEICGKAFLLNGNLREHMRCHTGEKPYACNKCNKSFGHQSTLTQHKRRVHTEEKPFVCTRCSLSFTKESNLSIHMRIHTADRPFACDICNKTFFEARYLKGHMQVHSEERPHSCNACGKAYKRPEHLKLHLKHKCKASFAMPGADLQT